MIDLRYPRDRYLGANRHFPTAVKRERSGITATINLIELCGIRSFGTHSPLAKKPYPLVTLLTMTLDPIPPVPIGRIGGWAIG